MNLVLLQWTDDVRRCVAFSLESTSTSCSTVFAGSRPTRGCLCMIETKTIPVPALADTRSPARSPIVPFWSYSLRTSSRKIKSMPIAGPHDEGMARTNFFHFPIKKKGLFWRNSSIAVPVDGQNWGRSRPYIVNWTSPSMQFRLGFQRPSDICANVWLHIPACKIACG
jgi:hypothetical protein